MPWLLWASHSHTKQLRAGRQNGLVAFGNKYTSDGDDELLPAAGPFGQLFGAAIGQGICFALPAICGRLPGTLNQPVALQRVQGWVEGAFPELQGVFGAPLDSPGQRVAVRGTVAQGRQNQQGEAAFQVILG